MGVVGVWYCMVNVLFFCGNFFCYNFFNVMLFFCFFYLLIFYFNVIFCDDLFIKFLILWRVVENFYEYLLCSCLCRLFFVYLVKFICLVLSYFCFFFGICDFVFFVFCFCWGEVISLKGMLFLWGWSIIFCVIVGMCGEIWLEM